MSASARRSMTAEPAVETETNGAAMAEGPVSVMVVAQNRLLREALTRMLKKKENIDVVGGEESDPLAGDWLSRTNADVLLLTSRGTLHEDLVVIHRVRTAAPRTRIVLLGMVKNEGEFLQCVRAGINGYLLHDASAEDVIDGVKAAHAGEAVCPRSLCTALFRYLEGESSLTMCGSPRRRMGLTRREQQLMPLIAKGLTNKEIANHFSLSEQTVKNHLYRMKQKTHAEDRLDIVQLYRVQGFLV